MTDTTKIEALVEAGKLATEGEWDHWDNDTPHITNFFVSEGDILDLYHLDKEGGIFIKENASNNGKFITQAANARPEIKAMLDENKALYENSKSQTQTADAMMKRLCKQEDELTDLKDDVLKYRVETIDQSETLRKQSEVIAGLVEALESQIEATEQCMDNKFHCEEVTKTAIQFISSSREALARAAELGEVGL